MKYQPFEPSNFYNLYNRGNNKEHIFKNDNHYIYFLTLVKKHLLPICSIYSYCLLPNHFHFIIRIKDFEALPEKIRKGKSKLHQPFSNLFNAYTKAVNKQYKRTGSLFQEHLKRIQISNEAYLCNLIVYVNTNPKHHSFSEFENYKYSSYKSLISTKPTLLERSVVVQLFNDIDNFKFVHNKKKFDIEVISDYLLE